MLGEYQECLDVSQDIFLKLYGSLGDFRFESEFSTYLYRVTMNFCKNRLKSLQRKQAKEAFSLDAPIETKDGTIKRQVPDNNPTPKEALNNKEKKALIREAIDSLEPDFKEIVILREIEGFAYHEIAHVLEIDLGTVKSRLSRARFALRDKLRGMV